MRIFVGLMLVGLVWSGASGQEAPVMAAARVMADKVVTAWPAGVISTVKKPGEWGYEEGVLLDGMAAEYEVTKKPEYLAYVKAAVDRYVGADGVIRMDAAGKAYPLETHTLDDVEMGRVVMFMWRQTHEARYRKAAEFLHGQLALQPRGPSGGYWHKSIYPNQMWLDGAFMAEPFRAEYATAFGAEKGEWADIAKQFLLMDEHMRDPKTGLLRHGWDESKQMAWADKATGRSPEAWARAMGWFCVGLVDVLDEFPKGDPARGKLVAVFRRTMMTVLAAEGPDHTWRDVLGHGFGEENWREASASAMFGYCLMKGVRLGYLPAAYKPLVKPTSASFLAHYVSGGVLHGTVKASGLGGKPYRDGSYGYYLGEPVGDDDPKGVGAMLMMGAEVGR